MDFLSNVDLKFLMVNFKFLNEVKSKLCDRELLFKINRRLEVLNLIDNMSEDLKKYFYGDYYNELIESLSRRDIEILVRKVLNCNVKGIRVNVFSVSDKFLYGISCNSYKKIENHIGNDDLVININSNEFFLKDYDGISELYCVLKQLGEINLNFKIVDLFDKEVLFEDRIDSKKKESYVNINMTLFRIGINRNYLDLIKKDDLDECILNRLETLDLNPIWKYYLLIIKIENKENYEITIDLCKYLYKNINKVNYLDINFYEKVGAHSLLILCDIYLELCDYENLNKYVEILDNQYENCLDFIYFKAKILEHTNNNEIDNFINYVQEKIKGSNNYYSLIDPENKKIYESMGDILNRRGSYILSVSNFMRAGNFESVNKIGQGIVDINNFIYRNNIYNSGVFFTSKPFCDIDFISDTSNNFNMFDIANTDYIRTFILELCAREIKDYNIEGEVAELGVFRGDFAKFLNEVFSDRKLYLFDTFDSFDEKDIKIELDNKFMSNDNLQMTHSFLKNSGTSIDLVMDKMKYKDNIIIKKGYFPDSLNSLEGKFCFVSLDVDLYNPMLEGLKYFYERLSDGGYIFIHDYNHKVFGGIRAAVREFEKLIGKRVNKIPICDHAGSLIITK